MSATEQQAAIKAAEELRDLVKGYKAAADANAGQLTDISGKMAALETKMTALTQANDALNRAGFERSVQGNGHRDLDVYTRGVAAHDLQVNRAHYFTDPGKEARDPVRLTGHMSLRDPGDPRSAVKVWGLFDDPNPRDEWQRVAQKLLDRHNLVRAHLNGGPMDPSGQTRRAWQCESDLLNHMRSGPEQISKIFSNVSGSGSEWLPAQPLPEVERQVMFQPSRWQIFRQIQMSRSPIVRPRRSGFLTAWLSAVPAVDDPSADPSLTNWTSTNQTITAQELAVGAQYYINAEEDAILSFEAEIRNDLAWAHIFGIENTITNGDDTATHMDAIASWNTRGRLGTTGLGLANDARRAWKGLRKIARSLTSMTTDAGGAAVTFANINADLAKIFPESLLNSDGQVRAVIEVSPETFFGTFFALDQFDSFDNVGLLASVITGAIGDPSKTPGGLLPNQVGFINGRFPVIVNYTLTKDMNATGLFTSTGATTGTLTYDVSRFQVAMLRGMTVKLMEDIRNNTRTLVSRQRLVFVPSEDVSATNKSVHYRFNTI